MTAVPAKTLVDKYGLSSRYWIRMAAEGKIPGAHQPSGTGGKWVFDLAVFDEWWASTRREVRAWPGYTNAEKSGGAAPSVAVRNSADHLKQQISAWQKSASANG